MACTIGGCSDTQLESTAQSSPTSARVLVSYKNLPTAAKYSRAHIDRLIEHEGFPAPIRVSANRVAWWLHEVEAWLNGRPRRAIARKLPQKSAAEAQGSQNGQAAPDHGQHAQPKLQPSDGDPTEG
jgi:predicted DNA-binding transcriptional regulator AlpA